MADFVDQLQEEQRALESLLLELSPEDWDRPTPAAGWSVRDQVSHLADTEEVAHDTVVGGPRTLAVERERRQADGGLIEYGVACGRALDRPEAVLAWWTAASARTRAALRAADQATRVPWGLGMSWRAFVTARLMEHWAHGLDIRAAVSRPAHDTERLQPVAWIGWSALPYAFGVAGVEAPAGRTLRLELVGPAGEAWTFGPDDATDVVRGPASAWCRRAVQRIGPEEAGELEAHGPLAALAVRHARAFL